MKNTLNGIYNQIEMAEGMISKLKDILIEPFQNKKEKTK